MHIAGNMINIALVFSAPQQVFYSRSNARTKSRHYSFLNGYLWIVPKNILNAAKNLFHTELMRVGLAVKENDLHPSLRSIGVENFRYMANISKTTTSTMMLKRSWWLMYSKKL